MGFDWKGLVSSIAPTIATALGGPLAGVATQAVSQAVFGKPDAKEGELSQALAGASADTLAAIRKADQDFAAQMTAMGIDLEKIAAADRASAREREVSAKDSWTPRIIAGIVVGGWMIVQWFILNHVVAQEMREIILRSMGTIDMALGLVLGYYFGSSAGSENKNDLIANLTKK